MATDIDYRELSTRLPTGKTPEEKAKRDAMFKQFDPNGNGYLSLAEIDKGIHDILGLEGLYHCKPAIMRAYQAARAVHKTGHGVHDNDYVERIEFRLLLVYLKQYFELYAIFADVDTGGDHRINQEEFKRAIPHLASMGVHISDPAAAFNEIDKDHGGQILFVEFSDWAIKKNLASHHDGSE